MRKKINKHAALLQVDRAELSLTLHDLRQRLSSRDQEIASLRGQLSQAERIALSDAHTIRELKQQLESMNVIHQ